MVALITGNFDDSQSTGDVWTVAGYVGYSNQWDHFERLWAEALDHHGVPYFHMKEMNDPNGVFAKWLPPQDHEPARRAFFKDLVAAIRKSGLYMVSSTVWIKDVERFNLEKGLALEPYPLAAYSCMSLIAMNYDDLPVTAVFDRIEKVESKLAMARSYADSDRHAYPGLCDTIATSWLPKPLTSREVPALQAADLIAWEVRKANFGMRDWQISERPIGDRSEQFKHYMAYTREKTGEDPILRKSLDALLSDMPIKAIVWDYQQLTTTNEIRRGIWTPEAA